MKKRWMMLCLALLLSAFSICSSVRADSVTMKSQTMAPPQASLSKSFDGLLNEIEKRTSGGVKFERFYSAALAKPNEMLEATGAAIIDVSTITTGYTPGKTPLHMVGVLMGAYEHAWVGAKAFMELYKAVPALEEEAARNGVKAIAAWGGGPFLLLSKKKITTLEELKGMKIGAADIQAKLVKALGGAPVAISFNDAYMALSRGTVDAGVFSPDAVMSFGLHEAAKFVWTIPLGGGMNPVVMNLDKWKKLPEEVQKAVMAAGDEYAKINEEIYQIGGDKAAIEKMKQAGLTVTDPTPEVSAKLAKITREQIWNDWAKEMDGKGLAGTKVMEAYLKAIEKYTPLCPFK